RSQDPSQRRILDRATRQRRLNRQLEALENDNFQDDPHANMPQLDWKSAAGKKKKKTRGDHFKLRFRKNFQALLEEQIWVTLNLWATLLPPMCYSRTLSSEMSVSLAASNFQQNLNVSEGPNYLTACAPPSNLPQRHFCTVCGFPSNYTCVSCGARYCCVKCLGTHQETR
ncbi:hypothetical protein JD844_001139, partial [Phrynosoma platyrhinos]